MLEEYSKEQLWKIYNNLPQELKEAVFSEETAENIFEICTKNGIEEQKEISETARCVGRVLLGLLSTEKFQETLEEIVKISKESAKKINAGITRLVFYPVKNSLEKIYKTEIVSVAGMEKIPKAERKSSFSTRPDTYREPIE